MTGNMTGGLDESVRTHLAKLFTLIHTLDDPDVAELARAEMPRLISALKLVLDAHEPDEYGHCRQCQPGKRRHRLPFEPCRAYDSAQRFLAVERGLPQMLVAAQHTAFADSRPRHALH
ncbi:MULTISPECIES: hypothetical protein [unclassified Crossiella]|uniref:hypothetical protein n=1 Tax=unclassified Crossiella TaxID=2620835 RepID=UPI001FFE47A5|nr:MULTISPECIES: hypothetical protein [unclassified Crossiella]MCK2242287.1 hypothetical protein [Crossiella sp. S99.2]MCK2254682.1 hypothetical protein [Crossiella sp. S99.1]